MHADEHAGAMYMTMTIVRPGLFFQREGPGSEPGNSLLCPDEASCSSVCGVLGIVQCRASLLHKQHKQSAKRHAATKIVTRCYEAKHAVAMLPLWCTLVRLFQTPPHHRAPPVVQPGKPRCAATSAARSRPGSPASAPPPPLFMLFMQ